MKVADCIKRMNNPRTINYNRLLELKQYYMSMYRYYMLKMFDSDYVDDPTLFDKSQIYRNILDMQIKGMINSSGQIELSSERVYYAMCKNKSRESRVFLNLLYSVLKYKEASRDLDLFYESFQRSVSLKVRFRGSKIQSRTELAFNKANLSALLKSGKTLECVTIREDLWVLAMKVLGIPEADWYLDGMFDGDLTHEEEVQNINILLNGNTSLNGKYAKVLEDWLYNHKWSNSKMTTVNVGLIDYLYAMPGNDILDALQRVLDMYEDDRVFAILEDTIYLVRDIRRYAIPVSPFVVNGGYDDSLYTIGSAMYGYVGEAYSEEYLREEELRFIGLPIVTYDDDMQEVVLYDREQVSVSYTSWFKDNGVDFNYERVDIKNPFRDESLQHKLFEIYLKSQEGILGYVDASKYTMKDIETAKKKVTKALVRLLN